MIAIVFLSLLFVSLVNASGEECMLRKYKDGYVCVCTEDYCDTLEFQYPEKSELVHVVTSENGMRHKVFYEKTEQIFSSVWNEMVQDNVEIVINEDVTFQKVLGFGNALTGSVTHLLNKMSKELRNHVYNSVFSKSKGNGIKFLRIPLGGCDFDLQPWAYNEYPENDLKLSNFTKLDERDLAKIKILNEIHSNIDAHDLSLIGAAWSSPKWMKSNNDWTGRSKLKEEYYQTWADYHLKYLQLMDAQNVSFWGFSTGNEPLNGELFWLFIPFMSLGWNAKRQGTFVGKHLGPTIRNSKFKDIKLLSNDDQRYSIAWWFKDMEKSYKNSVDYIDGLAVHWYWDKFIPDGLLDIHHENYPNMIILNTEASSGDKPWEQSKPVLGSWKRAEGYIDGIMQDLEHWVNGWLDWNFLLDEQGGPNYADNYVDAPIIVNSTDYKEIYKQPFYYAFGHFSRFITVGSIRFDVQSNNQNVKALGFLRPDGYKVLIVYNKLKTAVNVNVKLSSAGNWNLKIVEKSINSILYK